jgi:hypothetical protein
MLDGSNFNKKCLLVSSIQNFFQIWKILNFLQENSEFSLKKGQKFVLVRLGRSWRAEIRDEHALLIYKLVATHPS